MHIRTALPADVEALQAIFRRASLSNEHDRAALLQHPEALTLTAAHLADGTTEVGVNRAGDVIGFITTEVDGACAEITDLFVDPAAMRQGVATALVDHRLQQLRDQGVVRVDVIANPHALAFYRAVGFAIGPSTPTPFGEGFRAHRDL